MGFPKGDMASRKGKPGISGGTLQQYLPILNTDSRHPVGKYGIRLPK